MVHKVLLTGDVHHMTMGGVDQSLIGKSETRLAIRMADIAARYEIKVTYFVTGRVGLEEPQSLSELSSMDNVELGGHTYDAFKPAWLYRLSRILFGLKCGTYKRQLKDVQKTIDEIRAVTGQLISSWRNHGYRNDRNTISVLERAGIKYYSDLVDRSLDAPFRHEFLNVIPINTWPDHDTINHDYARFPQVRYRLFRKALLSSLREYLLRKRCDSDGCLFSVQEWESELKEQIKKRSDKDGSVSVLLIHPACMDIIDEFKVFESLCKWIRQNNYESCFVKDVC